MGYETAFDIIIREPTNGAECLHVSELIEKLGTPEMEAAARLKNLWVRENSHGTLKELAELIDVANGGSSLKWYDFQSDMLRVSALLPMYIFEVVGRGEDSDDHWLAQFFNGECRRKKFVKPDLAKVSWGTWE